MIKSILPLIKTYYSGDEFEGREFVISISLVTAILH